VAQIISSSIGWSIAEVVIGSIVAFFLGNYLGSMAGYNRESWKDVAVVVIFGAVLAAVPTFAIIMYLEMWLSLDVNIFTIKFPSLSSLLSPQGIVAFLRFYTLPELALVLTLVSGFALGMRNNTMHTLRDNYVIYAEALGIRPKEIRRMVYKNSLLPNITGFALSLGLAISEALTVEGLLLIPGLGTYFGTALGNKDLPLFQGIFLVVAIMLIISIAVAELVYGYLDPRARLGQE
jgi:peptide/nickel transport system permease protein